MAGSYTDSTTSSTTNSVWNSWVCDTGTSATSNEVWTIWTTGDSTTYGASNVYQPPPETEEQRLARLERERQRREEAEAAKRERDEAKRKAEELLRESLDREQREQFDATKWFYVISQSGKRYRIRNGWAGNVDELNEDDLIIAEYCIHPQEWGVPTEDNMLIQKLMLEADEERFLEIANRRSINNPRPIVA